MKLKLGEPIVLGLIFVPESMCSRTFVDIEQAAERLSCTFDSLSEVGGLK